jgi:hypothetical protein
MTILISAFGFAGRFAGDLLTSALGWASSLLFGRVPRDHQIFVVLMMAGSFLWVLVVLGLLIPSIASFYLNATPHPPFVDNAWLGFVLVVSAFTLPLLVGAAGFLVPSDGKRPTGIAAFNELLRGYLLAPLIAGLLVFLAGVGMARKARSKRHHWADIHIAIITEPDGYDRVATDVEDALRAAGLKVTANEAPRIMSAPAWLLTRVAGPNVAKLRPDRLIEISGRNLRVGIYPSDIAISGSANTRILARAAILSRLVTSPAHQATSAEGQKLEDRLRRVAETDGGGAPMSRTAAREAFASIDADLLRLAVPTDEWDVLLRIRLQVERDLLMGEHDGIVQLSGPAPTSHRPAGAEAASPQPDVRAPRAAVP